MKTIENIFIIVIMPAILLGFLYGLIACSLDGIKDKIFKPGKS